MFRGRPMRFILPLHVDKSTKGNTKALLQTLYLTYYYIINIQARMNIKHSRHGCMTKVSLQQNITYCQLHQVQESATSQYPS